MYIQKKKINNKITPTTTHCLVMEMKKVLQSEGRDAKNLMAYHLSNIDTTSKCNKIHSIRTPKKKNAIT